MLLFIIDAAAASVAGPNSGVSKVVDSNKAVLGVNSTEKLISTSQTDAPGTKPANINPIPPDGSGYNNNEAFVISGTHV